MTTCRPASVLIMSYGKVSGAIPALGQFLEKRLDVDWSTATTFRDSFVI